MLIFNEPSVIEKLILITGGASAYPLIIRSFFIFKRKNDQSVLPQLVAKLPRGHNILLIETAKDIELKLNNCLDKSVALGKKYTFDSSTFM